MRIVIIQMELGLFLKAKRICDGLVNFVTTKLEELKDKLYDV